MRKVMQWVITPRYHATLGDVFWRSLITATLLPLAVWLAAHNEIPPNDPTHSLRVSVEEHARVDWRDGAYWVGDVRVRLDCPTEDSCQSQWTGEHWWIYKVEL